MGIDLASLMFLSRVIPDLDQKSNMIMLGRQKLHFRIPRFQDAADAKLSDIETGLTIGSLSAIDNGFAEPFFQALGVAKIDSLDFSDFESATVLHDLNQPLPKKLHRKYDLVFDGGTLEHVFDVKTALTNAYNLLKPGGTFIGISPGNNFFAHGFYQFSPDIVFSFWGRSMGCDVSECWVLPERPKDRPWQIEDPFKSGHRLRVRGRMPHQRTYLAYVAHRPNRAKVADKVLQGDYSQKWDGHYNEKPA